MSIKIGNIDVSYFKVGGADCSIYIGSEKLYPEEPSFEGKYMLTLSDSSVVSAECDGTSAITEADTSAYASTLTTAEIGECVTTIGDYAFENCRSLTSVTISDSITTISMVAFFSCSSLASIDIPSGVTSIGDYAFRDCSSLTSITVNATNPPSLGDRVFIGSTCPIYVPSESVEAYKTASEWSTYASRIQAIT